MFLFIVPPPFSCTISDFLRQQKLSLNLRRKIKKSGQILLNGQPTLGRSMISPGDVIEIILPSTSSIIPSPTLLDIVYEDNYILVINKPAGMLVHPTTQEKHLTLANAVIYYYIETGQSLGFHPVHRLDRNTSGLVIIAKNPYIQHQLSRDNIKHIQRAYIAVATGSIAESSGTIDAPIGRDPCSIIKRQIKADGQHAITRYRVLKPLKNATLVTLELLTGRTHQIRVHLASIGHPLLGDDLYGGSINIISRPALHSAHLTFKHPMTGSLIDLSSPLPEDIITAISILAPD